VIVLPFPPAEFSGHNTGAWFTKSPLIAAYRLEAKLLTKTWMRETGFQVPPSGDILISFRFVPPDKRGDRTNFAGRLKPQIDGIADALEVNDARFLPSYAFAGPEKPGRVEVRIWTP
jgi:crossover junction endodeoxyribonuclease RusA